MLPTATASAMPITPTQEQTEQIMLQTRVSSKYSCTPEQLAGYIEQSSSSLSMRPSVPDAKEHINNQVIESQASGEESCFAAFGNMDVINDMKRLLETIQALDPSALMPSNDAIMALLKQLADQLYSAAMDGVCGTFTQELAMEMVNDMMEHELGFDMKDVNAFDANKYSQKQAKSFMSDQGFNGSGDMTEDEYWESLLGDGNSPTWEDSKDEVLDNMFE